MSWVCAYTLIQLREASPLGGTLSILLSQLPFPAIPPYVVRAPHIHGAVQVIVIVIIIVMVIIIIIIIIIVIVIVMRHEA